MSHSVMRFGHSSSCQDKEDTLWKEGYELLFCCTHIHPRSPDDFECLASWNGWDYRRAIKAWVKKHGIVDFKILRNTTYVPDLHGPFVYELWVRRENA